MDIRCSVNRQIIDKPDRSQMRLLTEGFEPAQFSLEQLQEEIRAGHAFTPAVLQPDESGNFRRNNDAFGSANTVWIDIDNSVELPDRKKRRKTDEEGYVSLSDFTKQPFIQHYSALIYTSVSHTDEWNRFRVIFHLPEMVSEAPRYRQIIEAFIRMYDADPACKDQSRVFYGNQSAEFTAFGHSLTNLQLDFVMRHAVEVEQEEQRFTRANVNGQLTEDVVRGMLSHIPPQGEYVNWVKIVSAVASKFDEQTTVKLIEEWSPGYPGEVQYKVAHRMQRVGFGSLVYYARLCGWEAPSGFYKEEKKKRSFMNTDLGNAERFIDQYDTDVRFEHKSGFWFIYDGKRFRQDETGYIHQLAKTVIRSIYREAAEITGNDEEAEKKRKALGSWASKSEAKSRITNMISLASNDPVVARTFESFDQNPLQINLRNGVFDLATWNVLAHAPTHEITQLADVEYDDQAICPKWDEFLTTIFAGDQGLIDFVQRAVGYSLSGLTSEQCLFFCYGHGKNGKSVFFDVLKLLLGDYYQKAPTEMLLLRRQEGIPNDVARLRGSRMVVAAELPENKRFNESRIKDLTGEDRIVARYLHGEFFEFDPTHKLWIFGNHKPIITGTDEGIWRRIHMIPFTVTISPEKQRPKSDLIDEFKAEMSGILRWALHGFYHWYNKAELPGLRPPKSVLEATAAFRSEMDVLGAFIEECIDPEATTCFETYADTYKEYSTWCEKNGEHPMKSRTFNQHMRERGFEGLIPQGQKTFHWKNIRLLSKPF